MLKARQQIDTVLKYLYDNKDKSRAILYDTIKADSDLLKIIDNETEIERMIGKLKQDSLVHIYPDYPLLSDGKKDMKDGLLTYCSITFEGRLFWENGGYTKEEETNVASERIKSRLERHLVYGTWAVAFGAVALVVWEMVKTFLIEKPCH